MPAAMASTFFSAPQISTPVTSVEVLTRMYGPASSCCTCRASLTSCGQGVRVGRTLSWRKGMLMFMPRRRLLPYAGQLASTNKAIPDTSHSSNATYTTMHMFGSMAIDLLQHYSYTHLAGGDDDGGAQVHDLARKGGPRQEDGRLLALQGAGDDLRHHQSCGHLQPLADADDGQVRRQHALQH